MVRHKAGTTQIPTLAQPLWMWLWGGSGSLFLSMWLSWLLLSICFKKVLQGTPWHLVKCVHFWKKRQQAQSQDAPFSGPLPICLCLAVCG